MNIANITALAKQLHAIGIENAASALLKRICFHPQRFSLVRKVSKGADNVGLQLFFEKVAGEEYALHYYDATLQKEPKLGEGLVNGVDITGLDMEMGGIDWKNAFEVDDGNPILLDDKKAWEQESKIESVMTLLIELEATEMGKSTAALLKGKHWSGAAYLNLVGPINVVRNKNEVSQRFYTQDRHNLISIDEAYRFLQNKWLEKRAQENKKQKKSGDDNPEYREGDSSGNGSLKKNGASRGSKKGKSKHSIK